MKEWIWLCLHLPACLQVWVDLMGVVTRGQHSTLAADLTLLSLACSCTLVPASRLRTQQQRHLQVAIRRPFELLQQLKLAKAAAGKLHAESKAHQRPDLCVSEAASTLAGVGGPDWGGDSGRAPGLGQAQGRQLRAAEAGRDPHRPEVLCLGCQIVLVTFLGFGLV